VIAFGDLGEVLLAWGHHVRRTSRADDFAAIATMMASCGDRKVRLAQQTDLRGLIRDPLFLSDVGGTRDDRILGGGKRCFRFIPENVLGNREGGSTATER